MLRRSLARVCIYENGSVMGTSLYPQNFIKQVLTDTEELRQLEKDGMRKSNAYVSCIAKSDMDHMESPEQDNVALDRLSKRTDDLFARIPMPADPMRAALRKTDDELAELEDFELLKESVRIQYQNSKRRKLREQMRIDGVMKKVADGDHHVTTSDPMAEIYQTSTPASLHKQAPKHEASASITDDSKEQHEEKPVVAADVDVDDLLDEVDADLEELEKKLASLKRKKALLKKKSQQQ